MLYFKWVQRFWVQRSGLYQDRFRGSGFNVQGYIKIGSEVLGAMFRVISR
jgi:hypothetical protein